MCSYKLSGSKKDSKRNIFRVDFRIQKFSNIFNFSFVLVFRNTEL